MRAGVARRHPLKAIASRFCNRTILAATVVATLLPACAPLPRVRAPAPVSSAEDFPTDAFAAHVRVLADPALGGRVVGTAGNAKAREYIVREFASAGLKPGGQDGWLQGYGVWDARVPTERSALAMVGGPALRPRTDFAPMALGGGGEFEGPLVFAGYGIAENARCHNDYAGLEARGAVVMVLRGEPADARGRSRWTGSTRWTKRAALAEKLATAARAGAAAVLVVTPPRLTGEHDLLYNVLGRGGGPIPAMRISVAAADRLLAAGTGGESLAELAAKIDGSGEPASAATGVRLRGRTAMEVATGRNVIGVLPATEGDGGRTIVLGAHYDHLTIWGRNARDRGFGVRPGADDNASGVAGVILVARAMATVKRRRCRFVFIAFDAEEYGFVGSNHYVAAHDDVGRIACMVCLDQIGQMRKSEVMAIGNVWDKVIDRALRAASHVDLRTTVWTVPLINRRGWSDQAAFARREIPTLLINTGPAATYHRRTDTADSINPAGGAKVARLIFEMLLHLDAAYGSTARPKTRPAVSAQPTEGP